jgi:hypothetical protein
MLASHQEVLDLQALDFYNKSRKQPAPSGRKHEKYPTYIFISSISLRAVCMTLIDMIAICRHDATIAARNLHNIESFTGRPLCFEYRQTCGVFDANTPKFWITAVEKHSNINVSIGVRVGLLIFGSSNSYLEVMARTRNFERNTGRHEESFQTKLGRIPREMKY